MRGKLLPLLLALCLTLTACGAPPVSDPPDDAAPESQPSVPAERSRRDGGLRPDLDGKPGAA